MLEVVGLKMMEKEKEEKNKEPAQRKSSMMA